MTEIKISIFNISCFFLLIDLNSYFSNSHLKNQSKKLILTSVT